MKLILIRHGQTQGNILNEQGINLFTGALNNKCTDLTEKGIEAAKKLKDNPIIKEITKVYCSDLKRAIDTAKLAKPGYKLHIDKRLRERSLGDFEGKYPEDLEDYENYKKYFTDENYKIEHIKEDIINGQECYQVKLKNIEKRDEQLKIWIGKQTGVVKKIEHTYVEYGQTKTYSDNGVYNIEINKVTNKEVEKPDFSDYQIINAKERE